MLSTCTKRVSCVRVVCFCFLMPLVGVRFHFPHNLLVCWCLAIVGVDDGVDLVGLRWGSVVVLILSLSYVIGLGLGLGLTWVLFVLRVDELAL